MVDAYAAAEKVKRIKDMYEKNLIQNVSIVSEKYVVSKDFIKIGKYVDNSNFHNPVTIQKNASFKTKASNSIKIENGFHSKRGSTFNAKIIQFTGIGCYTYATTNKTSGNHNKFTAEDLIYQNLYSDSIKMPLLYPIPLENELNIEFNLVINSKVKIQILNQYGKILFEKDLYIEQGKFLEKITNKFLDRFLISKITINNECFTQKILNNFH